MRKEFYIGTEEDMTDYMERAAAYLRSIKKGALIDEGINLSEALPVEEQKELMQYIYGMVINLMMKTSGRYVLNRIDFGSYKNDFTQNYAEVILKRLDLFRDPERITEESKSYRFPTFLDRLSGEAILTTYAQMHDVSPKVERKIYRVLSAIPKIAVSKQKNCSEVTPYEIHCMCQDISESDILSILRYRNRTSLDQLMEEGMLEIDAIQGDEGIQLEVFEELDADIISILHHFFDRLTDMEKLFVLLHVRCCDEAYGKMTAEELSVSSLVVSIAAASEKLRKSILTGNLTICRPKRSSAEGNTSIKLKNVEIVSYNVIRYHRKKAADHLKSLGKRIPIEDFSGRHAVKFFEAQWNELVEKYSF